MKDVGAHAPPVLVLPGWGAAWMHMSWEGDRMFLPKRFRKGGLSQDVKGLLFYTLQDVHGSHGTPEIVFKLVQSRTTCLTPKHVSPSECLVWIHLLLALLVGFFNVGLCLLLHVWDQLPSGWRQRALHVNTRTYAELHKHMHTWLTSQNFEQEALQFKTSANTHIPPLKNIWNQKGLEQFCQQAFTRTCLDSRWCVNRGFEWLW